MNPSVLIFVALAVAWLAYLIPKALEHTEVGERTRAVVDFSHRLRVLGRREPAPAVRRDAKPAAAAEACPRAEATVSDITDITDTAERPAVPSGDPALSTEPTERSERSERAAAPAAYLDRSAYNRAARRRRNVLATLGILLFVVAVLAVFAVVPKLVVAGPVVLLAAWLVACRLMVRRERPAGRRPVVASSGEPDDDAPTGSITLNPPAIGIEEDGRPESAQAADPTTGGVGGWDPVQVPLPTYVDKPAARRSVRTIDLDGTGVWSSGRNDSDSALAREADAARKSEPTQEARRRSS